MVTAVFSWRCKCGIRVKVIGETEGDNRTARTAVKCPGCDEEQILRASRVISVLQENEEPYSPRI
jgi:hypothetical protein